MSKRMRSNSLICSESFRCLIHNLAYNSLDCPHYTRPEVYQGAGVPPVLLGGHHGEIEQWRREQSLAVTLSKRPELIAKAREQGLLSKADEAVLKKLKLQ